jgi:hypothetical protein
LPHAVPTAFPLEIFARSLPFGRNPLFSFKAREGRVKGPVLNLQQIFVCLLGVLKQPDVLGQDRTKELYDS